jgi:hypothetical protein
MASEIAVMSSRAFGDAGEEAGEDDANGVEVVSLLIDIFENCIREVN